ncbi:hypothetical protein AB833_13070 [Chromatiales bacterium (ex Bugula neritina AB1)]|nr:hypothetical protein AB833_13070 [Chromatiales bacterium (ex Bugula neritina AB1)]
MILPVQFDRHQAVTLKLGDNGCYLKMAATMNQTTHPLRLGHTILQRHLSKLNRLQIAEPGNLPWWELLSVVQQLDKDRISHMQQLTEYQCTLVYRHWTVDALIASVLKRLDEYQLPLRYIRTGLRHQICGSDCDSADELLMRIIQFKNHLKITLDLEKSLLLRMLAMLLQAPAYKPGIRLVHSRIIEE